MDEIDRRALIGAAALAGAATVSPALASQRETRMADLKKEAEVACIYHLDFGDPARFTQLVTNISNHFSVYGANPFEVQLAIVAHGQGIKFFLEDLEGTPWKDEVAVPKLFERVVDQARNGLKVYLCEITFKRLNIDRAKARTAEFVSFVPSGVAAVAALQSKGFSYIKVG
jgi:intracellular sulfur oxidation DsrE/DsrF family protein